MTRTDGTPAVLYAAKSTQDRKKSIPTQLDDCQKLAEERGWQVAGKFSDEGFSAYSGNRGPNLQRAKNLAAHLAAERGEAYIVVQHTDRLARGAGDAPGAADSLTEIWHSLARQNVRLASVQNPDAATEPVYAALAAKMSHEESKRKSAATRSGKRRRAERGESTGPLPFGYRLVPSDGDGKKRVPDPDEAPFVRRVFAMVDEGRGVGEITRWLNGQGARTKRGNAFGRSRVRELLRNPWYGGKVRAYGEEVDGNHEALLPWDEFERIRAKIDGAADPVAVARRKGGRPSEVALLSGVMFCAHCGHGIWHRKGSRRRYVCGHVRHATGECDAAPFDAETVERAVLDHLSNVFIDFDSWLEGVVAHRRSQREGRERELAAIQQRREQLDSDLRLVKDDYMKQLRIGNNAAGQIAAERVAQIEEEKQQLLAAEGEIRAALSEQERVSATDDMLDFWNELSDAVRRQVVNADSVKEANTALRERFAAIFVRSRPDGTPRLDFVLRDREPGAPLVSTNLWIDGDEPADEWLVNAIHKTEQTDPLTLVKGPVWGYVLPRLELNTQ